MLDQLMWKDLQNQKGILLMGLLFLLGPYLLFFFMGANSQSADEHLANAATMSLVLSQLTVVVMGATVVGHERQNQGMDFLLALPAPRSKVLLSKAIVSLIVAAIIWGLFVVVLEAVVAKDLRPHFRDVGSGSAMIGVTLFGVSWLGSILLRSTAAPIAISLTVVAVVALAVFKLWQIRERTVYEDGSAFATVLFSIYLAIGVCCFIAGWIVFTRRFEP